MELAVGRRDLARSVVLAGTSAAVVAVPTLGPLVFGSSEDTDRYDTAITPPGYAFAVWAPIFAGIIANAARGLGSARRCTADQRASGWPLAAAHALNCAWSLAAQSHRFHLTPALLSASVAATGVAHARLQALRPAEESVSTVSTGALLGWTALAATVNLSAGTQLLGADPRSRSSVVGSTLASVAAAGTLGTVIRSSARGYLPLAVTAAWGTLTTALDSRRDATARVGSAAGTVAIVIGATRRWRGRHDQDGRAGQH
jgi:hypothetical protein